MRVWVTDTMSVFCVNGSMAADIHKAYDLACKEGKNRTKNGDSFTVTIGWSLMEKISCAVLVRNVQGDE